MAEAENKQRKLVRRPAEERIAEIDKKIAGHKDAIQKLEAKKNAILNPRASKAAGLKALISKAKDAGMSNEEIAQKLGISLDEPESTPVADTEKKK